MKQKKKQVEVDTDARYERLSEVSVKFHSTSEKGSWVHVNPHKLFTMEKNPNKTGSDINIPLLETANYDNTKEGSLILLHVEVSSFLLQVII